jgi:hypothetical protein
MRHGHISSDIPAFPGRSWIIGSTRVYELRILEKITRILHMNLTTHVASSMHDIFKKKNNRVS